MKMVTSLMCKRRLVPVVTKHYVMKTYAEMEV
jgi:hypothetical protein